MKRIWIWIAVAGMWGIFGVERAMAGGGCSQTGTEVSPAGPYCLCGDDLSLTLTKRLVCNSDIHAEAKVTDYRYPRAESPGTVALSLAVAEVTCPLPTNICSGCNLPITVLDASLVFTDDPGLCEGCSRGSCTPGRQETSCGSRRSETWRLGVSASRPTAGYISLEFDTPSASLATPGGLKVEGLALDVDEVRDIGDTNRLRQVLAPECLVDVVTNTAFKYTMNFYRPQDVELMPQVLTGYYVVKTSAQAFASVTIENPSGDPNDCDTLWVVNSRGGTVVTNVWMGTNTASGVQWSVLAGGLRRETLDRTTNGTERIDVRTVLDKDNNVASKIRTTARLSRFGYTTIETVVDPDGAALTDTTLLYEESDGPGRYGRTRQTIHADGSWARYDYNTNGWKTLEVTPWQDGATNAADAASRVTTYAYDPVDANDLGDLPGYMSKPRTVVEKIADKEVGRTYHAYYENDGGERVEIEERCAQAGAAYGASSNLRTVRVYTQKSDLAWEEYQSEKIKSVTYPDGRKDSHAYERGNYVTNAEAGVFTESATGEYVRVTVTEGTATSTNGVAGKSVKRENVRTWLGREVMNATYVYTGSGHERIAWSVNTLDEDGRPVLVRKSDGTRIETGWACCGKEWESGADGRLTSYSYDALNRVVSEEVEGVTNGAYGTQSDLLTTHVYDAEGRQLGTTVQGGSLSQATSNAYDMAGRMVFSRDASGISTEYLDSGLTNTTIRAGLTNVTVRHVDGSTLRILENGVIKTTYEYGVNADGTRWTKTYTGSAGTESPMWTRTTRDLLGRTVQQERPGFGGTVLTNAYVYDNAGQLIKTTQSGMPDTLYEYDELGNQTRSGVDVNGNGSLNLAGPDRVSESASWYEADGSGHYWQSQASILYAGDNATPTTNSLQKTRLTGLGAAEALGTLASELLATDLFGNQTVSRTYIARDSKTVSQVATYPDSATNAVQVTVNGHLVATTPKTGHTTTYAYDGLGRQNGMTDPRTGASTIAYDSHGWATAMTDAAGHVTSNVYDAATGRRIATVDPLGQATYYSYSPQGQVTETYGATYPVAYGYDEYGRMTSMATWREASGTGDVTRWQYDLATGMLTNKVYADGKGTAYTYTPDGKLARRTWARGVTTDYTYDSLGQMTNINYSSTNTPDVSFSYDRLGRHTTITDGQGTRTFTYNDALQLATETNAAGVITRVYDGLGRGVGFDAGADYSVRYSFDTVGRFASVGSEVYGLTSNVCTYSYLPNSDLIASVSNTVGGALCAATTRTYEEHRNLLTAIENASVTGTVSRYAYVNDAAGRRTSVTMTGPAFEIGPSFNAYSYNERSELIQAKRCFGTDLEDTTDEVMGQGHAYGYDLIGNRTNAYDGAVSGTDARRTYTANALNQYVEQTVPARANIMGTAETGTVVTVNNQATSRFGKYFQAYAGVTNSSSAAYPLVTVVGVLPGGGTNGTDVVSTSSGHVFVAKTPEQFSYDDDGNLLEDGRWSYEWDAENRLIGMETLATLPAAVPRLKLSFAYDYMSRRVTKTVTSDDSSFIPHTSSFLYDGWAMIRELITDNGSPVTNSYTYGLDLSGTLQGAGTIGGLLSRSKVSGLTSNVCFYAYDANGNVGQLIATNGATLAHYEYDPYGNIAQQSGSEASANPFRFSTKYLDQETGLYYYGLRFYHPGLGRWVSRDPVGERGGFNLNGYIGNAPTCEIDAIGLSGMRGFLGRLVWHLMTGQGQHLHLSGAGSLSDEPNVPETMAELKGLMRNRVCAAGLSAHVVFNSLSSGCTVPGSARSGRDPIYWLINDLDRVRLNYTCVRHAGCNYRCSLEWSANDRLDWNLDRNPYDRDWVRIIEWIGVDYIDPEARDPLADPSWLLILHPRMTAFSWTATWREDDVEVRCQ